MKKLLLLISSILIGATSYSQVITPCNCYRDTIPYGTVATQYWVLSQGYATQIALNDTAAAIRSSVSGAGTVTSIATSYGIIGGTITTTGTLHADTTLLSTIGNVVRTIYSDTTSLLATQYFVTSQGYATQVGLVDTAANLRAALALKVDTIYRTVGKDSIQFTIGGRYHAILDSAGASSMPAWNLTGNSGTSPAINFLGTIDDSTLVFKQHNIQAGRINGDSVLTFWGQSAGLGNTAEYVNAIGQMAAQNNTGTYVDAMGNQAAKGNTGTHVVAIGFEAALNNTVNNITAIGFEAASGNTSVGVTDVGFEAGASSNGTNGNYSTLLGYNAVDSLGYTNATAIGANAMVKCSNCMILGSIPNINGGGSGVNVGIGTASPSTLLHINSSTSPAFRLVDGTQGVNKVLTSDANGNASWSTAASSGWSLTGNSGTSPGTNFVGTTDAENLEFKVNGTLSGVIDNVNNSLTFGYGVGTNLTGQYVTDIGWEAGGSNGAVTENTNVGALAGSGSGTGGNNTNVGVEAGNASQSKGTAVGVGVLESASGTGNTAVGYNAANNITTGTYNNAFGFNAINGDSRNKTGTGNNGFGYQALMGLSSGSNNSAIGYNAGINNTTGSNNNFMGQDAGNNDSTGSHNICIGDSAGSAGLNTIQCTYVGDNAYGTGDNLTNATAIGANANVATNNTISLGNTSIVSIGTSGDYFVSNNAKGVVLEDSNNNCWRIVVSPAGVLSTTSITCPTR